MKVESIKNNLENVIDISSEIYNLCVEFKKEYPNFKTWFYSKQLLESLFTNKRDILYIKKNNMIIGFTLLKNYKDEKKLCTIYVKKEFRNQKIGTFLLIESFKYLETDKPVVTLRDYKLFSFNPIIKKYNWTLDNVMDNYYGKKTKELCFNIKK